MIGFGGYRKAGAIDGNAVANFNVLKFQGRID